MSSMNQLSPELSLAKEAALKAGQVIKAGFGKIKKISVKADKSFVTGIDKQSQELIISKLKTGSTYPIIAEESKVHAKGAGTFWSVDPLDGTTNYIRGIPIFAVSIALVKNNHVELGVVYHPLLDECFYAQKNSGAYFNDKMIHVSQKSQSSELTVVINSGYDKTAKVRFWRVCQRLIETESVNTIRFLGTSAFELCYLASGIIDGFICSGDKLWDHAAGICIVQEAGGEVTDWRGKKWNNENSFILATNGLIHQNLSSLVADLQV